MGTKINLKTSLVMSVLLVGIYCASAAGGTIYVDADASPGGDGSSWATAYKYLQDALNKPPTSGDEIWVAAGVYKPDQDEGSNVTPGDRSATFQLTNSVAIYGSFPSGGGTWNDRDPNDPNKETILSGDLNGNDVEVSDPCDLLDEPTRVENSYHVVTDSGTDANAVLDGFTITAGNANGLSYPHHYGAGMINLEGDPNIVNCIFTGNSAIYGGGMCNLGSNLQIADCAFVSNAGDVYGGGIFNYSSSPTLKNCYFQENKGGFGGGMLNYSGSNPKLIDCTFKANWAYYYGAGMYNDDSDPNLINCDFVENLTEPYADTSARGAGMYNYNSNPILINCSFIRNKADHPGPPPYISCRGGGIYDSNSSPELYGCNFTENFANQYGGAICNVDSSHPTIVNSLFARNEARHGAAIYDYTGSSTAVNCQFSGNRATYGGGIYNNTSTSTITNCTFCANIAGNGAGICAIDSILSVSNCILWGNTDTEGTDENAQVYTVGGTPVVSYSCVQGWTGDLGGVGNIGDDPMLMREPNDGGDGWGDDLNTINIDEAANDDYGILHILPGSPCIDAGDNAAVPPDAADLDNDGNTNEPIPWDLVGDPRFVDEPNCPDTGSGTPPIVDMGAYEGPKQGFLLSTKSLTIPEGATASFTIALRLEPAGDFEVTVANESGDPNVLVESGALLVFNPSNYSIPQGVTVRATEDDDHFHGTASIAVAAPQVETSRVQVNEVDNEPYPNILLVDANAPGADDGSSWEDAFTDLQEALDVCTDLQRALSLAGVYIDFEIWVAEGVYKPAPAFSGDRFASFTLMRHLVLKGGYAGFSEPDPDARDVELYETILSGDLDGDDVGNLDDPSRDENSHHVLTGSYTDGTTVLDGFTITAGNASMYWGYFGGGGLDNYKGHLTVSNCKFINNSATAAFGGGGGAVHNRLSNATITNCSFIGNQATGSGSELGGGAIYNHESTPTISGCAFTGNVARDGGSVYNNTSNATISNCAFNSNVAKYGGGGAIKSYSSAPTIMNSTFTENHADSGSGGAVYGGNGTVINCTFSNNSAMNGGGMLNTGAVINCTFLGNSAISSSQTLNTGRGGAMFNAEGSSAILNCLFIGNYAAAYDPLNSGDGGALYNYKGEPTLVNCTVVANSATDNGGGICGNQARASNCIFWENLDDKGYFQASQIDVSDPNVNYCCIQGWTGSWGGSGNTGAEPNFVDANGPDGVMGTFDDNLRLSSGSPCIDAGYNYGVPADYVDLDNDGNTSEQIPWDLDGFERFIDDICTTDTGSGTVPIVDMGAHEFLRSDIDSNGAVDLVDFSRFALYWKESGCGACGGADLTCDGDADLYDLKEFGDNWLAGVSN